MFRLCLLVVFVSLVYSNPVDKIENKNNIIEKEATILNYDDQRDENGILSFSFDTSNEISRSERWYLRNVGTPKEHIAVQGQYSYIDPDGNRIVVLYSADENGYVVIDPEGDLSDRFGSPTPHAIATILG